MAEREPFDTDLADLPEEVFAWLDGDVTPEVDSAVSEWLGRQPGNRTILSELEQIWQLTRTPVAVDGWAALEKRIDELEGRPQQRIVPARAIASGGPSFLWRAAAVLLIGLGLGLLWPRVRQALMPPQLARVVVPAGSQTEVELPGGVTVHLNYASELQYVVSTNVREITLQGEAYISVPAGADHNLVVNTEAGVVRDLGTEFNVRARDGMTAVAVTEGKVQLGTQHGLVELTAGQESSVVVGGAPTAPVSVDLEQELGWMSRRLTFYDQPIAQVVKELEYRYGVVFEVTDPGLRAMGITAKISADAGARDAAEVICLAVQARCEREGKRWVISPR